MPWEADYGRPTYLWLGASINKDADVRLQMLSQRIEEPSMAVDLLCVLCLDAQDKLHGNEPFRLVLGWKDELRLLRNAYLCRVLEDVAHCRLSIDVFLHDGVLVDALRSEDAECEG